MLIIPPPQSPRKRPRAKFKASAKPAPPVALTLVSAEFDSGEPSLSLTFDREIDISAIDLFAITVNDPALTSSLYDGEGSASLTGPKTVKLILQVIGDATGEQIVLDAQSSNGIVAEDDGGKWAGATELGLPYP